MSHKSFAKVVDEEIQKQLEIFKNFDELEARREKEISELKGEEADIRNYVEDQESQDQDFFSAASDTIIKIQKDIEKWEYAKSVLREAAARASSLYPSDADADLYFIVQFLVLYHHRTLNNIAGKLKADRISTPSSGMQQLHSSQLQTLSDALRIDMKHAMIVAKSKEFREGNCPEDQGSFRNDVVLAVYFRYSCKIRKILVGASKTGITGDVKAQIKKIKKKRQPFEDALKTFTDWSYIEFQKSFESMRTELEAMQRVTFDAGMAPFGRAKKLEKLWMEKLGFVADDEAGKS